MGRLTNMVNTNLFRKKKSIDNDCDTSHIPSTTFSTFTLDSLKDYTISDTNINRELKSTVSVGEEGFAEELTNEPEPTLQPRAVNRMDIRQLLERVNEDNLEEKIYELERCYLFEQNNVIDRYELEKAEMIASHAEEKRSTKRAFEHEKSELLKEIERKDKIIFELTTLMKKESKHELHKHELEKQMEYYVNLQASYACKESKIRCALDNLKQLLDTNEAVANLAEFRNFIGEFDSLFSSFSPDCRSTEDVELRSIVHEHTQMKHENTNAANSIKHVNRCYSEKDDLEHISAKKSKEPSMNNGDEAAIQHELAQAYRKQKSELVKLFNSEKEDYEQCLKREKELFEKEVRTEYVNRMAVERKAWQETIEDLEREAAILKYERSQMDKNYCIGVDMMKTEFEREKNAIYRRYSDSCERMKKEFETRLKNSKTEAHLGEFYASPPPSR